jgi:competence protein ComGC
MERRPTSFAARTSRPAKGRGGVTLIEMIAACTLLSALVLVMVPLLSRLAEVRADVRDREYAVRQLRNLLEQHPLHDGLDESPLDAEPFSRLEEPRVEMQIDPQEDGSRRVTVSVSWLNSAGQRVQPLALSDWKMGEESR